MTNEWFFLLYFEMIKHHSNREQTLGVSHSVAAGGVEPGSDAEEIDW